MDRDTRTVVDALDAAREQCGLTNAEFARAVGTSPSRYSTYRTGKVAPAATFVVRALRIAKALAAADREEILTSLSAAASVDHAVQMYGERGSGVLALRRTLRARDALAGIIEHRPELVSAWEAAARVADVRWHTLFAALVGHTFETHGLAAPRWAASAVVLPEPWRPVCAPIRGPHGDDDFTPPWLAAHNIFIAATELSSPCPRTRPVAVP